MNWLWKAIWTLVVVLFEMLVGGHDWVKEEINSDSVI